MRRLQCLILLYSKLNVLSSPIKVLSVIDKRLRLRKKEKLYCNLRYGYFVTVNQIMMTTVWFLLGSIQPRSKLEWQTSINWSPSENIILPTRLFRVTIKIITITHDKMSQKYYSKNKYIEYIQSMTICICRKPRCSNTNLTKNQGKLKCCLIGVKEKDIVLFIQGLDVLSKPHFKYVEIHSMWYLFCNTYWFNIN
jgi:hypothetical protein